MLLNLADQSKSAIKYNLTTFPDSHHHIDVEGFSGDAVSIKTRVSSMNDLFILLQATEQLRKLNSSVKIHLTISYLLCGRYDRPMHYGDSFDLKVITGIIEGQRYTSITLYEPHSEISVALLGAEVEHPLDAELKMWLRPYLDPKGLAYNKVCIVAPDMGSVKRVQAFVKTLQKAIPVVVANKTRDPLTGTVTGIEILNPGEIREKAFIYDDLCDGGRTFTEIDQKLKSILPECFTTLVVTQGIFSKGFEPVLAHVNQIITTNSFKELEPSEELKPCVHVIKVI